MTNENTNPIVEFPSWETVESFNDTTRYKGYEFKQNLTENLWIYIECQNENALWSDKENILYFSFCNKANFPIASVRYVYSKDGYYAGIYQLLQWAKIFEQAFSDFRNKSELEK